MSHNNSTTKPETLYTFFSQESCEMKLKDTCETEMGRLGRHISSERTWTWCNEEDTFKEEKGKGDVIKSKEEKEDIEERKGVKKEWEKEGKGAEGI